MTTPRVGGTRPVNAPVLWIVGRALDQYATGAQPTDYLLAWDFLGVFDTRELAIAACTDTRDFVAPATLNVRFPDEPNDWPGCVYPLAEARTTETER